MTRKLPKEMTGWLRQSKGKLAKVKGKWQNCDMISGLARQHLESGVSRKFCVSFGDRRNDYVIYINVFKVHDFHRIKYLKLLTIVWYSPGKWLIFWVSLISLKAGGFMCFPQVALRIWMKFAYDATANTTPKSLNIASSAFHTHPQSEQVFLISRKPELLKTKSQISSTESQW